MLYPTSPITRANIRRLYADVFWYGILSGSAMGFLNIYAARLGAGAMEIGWLTAGPALVNLALSLPAAHWLNNRPLARITFRTALLQRAGYLALAALPWLFAAHLQVGATIWLILLMSFPAALLAISFNALFAEAVPAEARAEVVGRRNALLAVSQTFSALASGQILDHLAFPFNYQLVFLIGAAGGLASAYYLSRLQLPGRPAPALSSHAEPQTAVLIENDAAGVSTSGDALAGELIAVSAPAGVLAPPAAADGAGTPTIAEPGPGAGPTHSATRRPELRLPAFDLSFLPDLGLLRGAFGRFMLAYLLFYAFQYLCQPLFPLSFVNIIRLTDGDISLGNVLFYVTMFFASLRLGPMARKWGDRRLLGVSGMLFGVYPLLLGLADGPLLYWAASFFGGMVYAVISAALINCLMARVPDQHRAAGMAFHNLALNLGILIGSFSGPLLGDALGVQPSLLVGAALRIFAGILLWLWG